MFYSLGRDEDERRDPLLSSGIVLVVVRLILCLLLKCKLQNKPGIPKKRNRAEQVEEGRSPQNHKTLKDFVQL